MMDCEQLRELLDAYALGAAEQEEAAGLEEHLADCVRCWSALNDAQRAAAAIALSTALERAPQSLRRRILAEVGRAERPARPRLWERLRRLWPAGVGALAAAASASLAFALFLQTEVSDLRDDSDQLAAEIESADARLTEQQGLIATEIESADARLTQQQQLMAVLAAPDVQTISLEPTDPTSLAVATYHWSGSAGAGALLGNNLPPLYEGRVYRVWFLTESGSYPVGSFYAWDGIGQLSMDLEDVPEHPVIIGVSIQDAAEADRPADMFLFAEFPE